jgi:hypothetical protein
MTDNFDNGGIIGKVNAPTGATASGIWSLVRQFLSRSAGLWPGLPFNVEFLVLAGGGAGGSDQGGGGGAGGYRSSVSGESSGGGASAEAPALCSPGVSYTITVGAGAPSPATGLTQGTNGSSSIFAGITSLGGGYGGGLSQDMQLQVVAPVVVVKVMASHPPLVEQEQQVRVEQVVMPAEEPLEVVAEVRAQLAGHSQDIIQVMVVMVLAQA